MPRDGTKTRQRILDAAYTLFHRSGYSRVGVDEIAAGANVTKRTLYSHYPSKDALLAECLRSQAALAADGFKSWGQRLPASRDALVDALFDALSKWSATPRWAGSGFTRVAVELTDLPGHPARAIARRHKAMLEDYLTELLKESRCRASAREGAAVVDRDGRGDAHGADMRRSIVHCISAARRQDAAVSIRTERPGQVPPTMLSVGGLVAVGTRIAPRPRADPGARC